MKKHDALFTATIIISAGLFSIVIMDNLLDRLHENKISVLTKSITPDQSVATDIKTKEDTLQKKFEKMGLTLHDGKYWKEIK